MQMISHLVNHFDTGLVLDVTADDLPIRVYVAISEPDLEAVTAFVPPEQFEGESNLHVAAVGTIQDVPAVLEDVLFNMEADDALALLCADLQIWQAALEHLGYDPDASPLK